MAAYMYFAARSSCFVGLCALVFLLQFKTLFFLSEMCKTKFNGFAIEYILRRIKVTYLGFQIAKPSINSDLSERGIEK